MLRALKPALLRGLVAIFAAAALFSHADYVTVFAAASLKESLDAQVKAFEASTGHKVIVSYAASNALAKQVEAGAPANLFVSADLDWMNYVEAKGLITPGTRRDLVGNELVLIAPRSLNISVKLAAGVDLVTALGPARLAMANPDTVPAGKYGKAALEFLGAWSAVEKRVAPAENVRAALALVSRGEAPLGIVYRTDAIADPGVRIVDAFPAGSYPPVVYPIAQLKSTNAASAALEDYLFSPAARGVWQRFGFRPLP
jgi:molybdate transport system substrate-binding protein